MYVSGPSLPSAMPVTAPALMRSQPPAPLPSKCKDVFLGKWCRICQEEMYFFFFQSPSLSLCLCFFLCPLLDSVAFCGGGGPQQEREGGREGSSLGMGRCLPLVTIYSCVSCRREGRKCLVWAPTASQPASSQCVWGVPDLRLHHLCRDL